MISKLERVGFGLTLAPLVLLAGLVGGWWLSYASLPEKWVPTGAISGLLLGILVDVLILGKLLKRACRLGKLFWASVFLFYTIGVFGFFMGVPVFNTLLAIPAGFVIGAHLAEKQADPTQVRRVAGRTAWFTTVVLAFVCTTSEFLALISKSTASDLRGMLGLGIEITHGMIIELIAVGGSALLAVS